MSTLTVVKQEIGEEEEMEEEVGEASQPAPDQATIDITHTLQLLANASANISNPNALQENQEVSVIVKIIQYFAYSFTTHVIVYKYIKIQ